LFGLAFEKHSITNLGVALSKLESLEMNDAHMGIEAIISRGFSRDQAVKVYFGNHPEQRYDPSASYNFDRNDGNLSLAVSFC
jgi:hypothetical protein